jgi:dUTP pyrophosphatase
MLVFLSVIVIKKRMDWGHVVDSIILAFILACCCICCGLVSSFANNARKERMGKRKLVAQLKIKKLSEHAIPPSRSHVTDAGWDLFSAYDYEIPPHGKELVKTDIAVAVPNGTYGRVAPRSSLAWNHHIDVGAGVVDSGYRGNVGVVLFNHSDKSFKIGRGDRVAQLILEKIVDKVYLQVVDDLDATERGEGGFGSTGGTSEQEVTKIQKTQ